MPKGHSNSVALTEYVPLDNSWGTARNVGILTSNIWSRSDSVSPVDPRDFYVFELRSAGTVTIALKSLLQDADLELYDSSGLLLQESSLPFASPELIVQGLNAGRYYAKVVAYGSSSTSYRIEFSATGQTPAPPAPPPAPVPGPVDGAGNSTAAARNIGALGSTVLSFNDAVSPADTNDYYVFDLLSAGTVNLTLTGLSQDADLELLNSAGQLVVGSRLNGTSSEEIVRSLNAGRYYARVFPYQQANTNYRINFSATGQTPAPPAPPPAPNPTPVDFWTTEPRLPELWAFQSNNDKDADITETFRTFANGPASGIANLNRGENIVAVVDSGVRTTHEDLQGNLLTGYDFSGAGDSNPADFDGHGTHVAGTIAAASNGKGIIGSNPVAKILPVKVFPDSPDADATVFDVIEGVNYAVAQGAKVINMSLGGTGFSQAFYDALAAANNAGVLIVAAAGNESTNNDITPHYPSSFELPNIIAVGASTQSDALAGFSNYGRNSVDVLAPGVSILSLGITSDSAYVSKQGTSMATPLVAGILSAFWARNPGLTPAGLRQKLMATVDPLGSDRVASGGRVNMAKLFGLTSSALDSITGVQKDVLSEPSTLSAPTVVSSRSLNLFDRSTIERLDLQRLVDDQVIAFVSGASRTAKLANIAEIREKLSGTSGYGAGLIDVQSFDALGAEMIGLQLRGDPAQRLSVLERMLSACVIDAFELPTYYQLA